MPENNGGIDLSAAPSAEAALKDEELKDNRICHRSFQFVLDPSPALAGVGPAMVQNLSSNCGKEKCSLWDKDNDCCGDLTKAIALDVIANTLASRGAL